MMLRAPFIVPPGLRALREAWTWARTENLLADFWAADCPRLAEAEVQPGSWVLTGTTLSGGGLAATISQGALQIIRVEDGPHSIRLALPARIRVMTQGVPA